MIAAHFSGAPKEKPTFLKAQAIPRPLFFRLSPGCGVIDRTHAPDFLDHPPD